MFFSGCVPNQDSACFSFCKPRGAESLVPWTQTEGIPLSLVNAIQGVEVWQEPTDSTPTTHTMHYYLTFRQFSKLAKNTLNCLVRIHSILQTNTIQSSLRTKYFAIYLFSDCIEAANRLNSSSKKKPTKMAQHKINGKPSVSALLYSVTFESLQGQETLSETLISKSSWVLKPRSPFLFAFSSLLK